jgi:hypothetical protein
MSLRDMFHPLPARGEKRGRVIYEMRADGLLIPQ